MQNMQKRDKELSLVIIRFAIALCIVLFVGVIGINHVHISHEDAGLGYFIPVFLVVVLGLFMYGYLTLKKFAKQISDSEKELLQTNIRLEYAIKGTGDGLWDWNLITNEVYFSPQWKAMLGYKDEELPSVFASWEDNVHPEDLECTVQEILRTQKEPNIPYEGIHRLRHKDGHWVWILDRGQTIFDENGKAIQMIGFHTDITESKIQENKIKELGILLTNTINSVENILFVKDSEYRYVELNDACLRLIGLSREEVLGKTDYDLFDKEVADAFREKDEIILALEQKQENYEWVIYPDGSNICLLTSKSPLRNQNGETIGLVGSSIDVTDHKKLEEDLKASQEQFKQFMDYMPAQIYIIEENEVVYGNSSANTYFNTSSILGMNAEELLAAKEATIINDSFVEALEYGIHDDVNTVIDPGGEKKVFRNLTFRIGNKEKPKVGMVAIDITEEYKMNKEISRVLSAFERSNISVLMTDLAGVIEYVNPSWCKITGYSKEELIGQNPRIVKSGYISDSTYEKMWKQLTNGKVWNSEIKNVAKDGTEFWEDSTIIPTFNRSNEVDGYISFKIEISEKMRLKQELEDQEEMMIAQSRHAAMGEMISMIAHQWRQPISVIAMNATNILVDIELDIVDRVTLKEVSTNIIDQTQELSQTIDDFRNFFKPDKIASKELFSVIVKDTMAVMGKSLENNNIIIDTKVSPTLEITTYIRELMQVLINIIKNAKEALEAREQESKFISLFTQETQSGMSINILDNAGGIENDIMKKIFDPYFTTKGVKNGTGLGLYMSKTIVEKHLNGTIHAYNEGDGVCFSIELPLKVNND